MAVICICAQYMYINKDVRIGRQKYMYTYVIKMLRACREKLKRFECTELGESDCRINKRHAFLTIL